MFLPFNDIHSLTAVRVAAVAAFFLLAGLSVSAQQPAAPHFTLIEQAAAKYFQTLPDYEPGDLISRSQVEQALDVVKDTGWNVPARDAIRDRALADGSFLVTEFRTPNGRKFMRKISRQPGAFARLERLSSISRGKQLIRDLVRRKGGDEFVEYLSTTSSGRHLGQMLAGTKHGVDLNKPTGHIYTAEELIAELNRIYRNAAP